MITWNKKVCKKIVALFKYPRSIIPKRSYKPEMDMDQIFDFGNLVIVRRSLQVEEETFDRFELLKENALIRSNKDIVGLSMNILGTFFKVSDISFMQKSKAQERWIRGEKYLQLKYSWYVNYENKSTPIYFWLHDIHNLEFPYYRKDDREAKKLIKKLNLDLKVDEEGMIKFKGLIKILHAPNKLNYWHIELGTLSISEMPDQSEVKMSNDIKSYDSSRDLKDQGWKVQASVAIRDRLLSSAYKNIDHNILVRINNDLFLN